MNKFLSFRIIRGPRLAISLMILITLFCGILETLGFPHSIVFLLDFFNIYLFASLLKDGKLLRLKMYPIIKWQFLMLFLGIVTAIMNSINPILILWSLRNLGRFVVFFLACVEYLRVDDIKRLYSFFKTIFLLNFLVIMYQYIVLGLRQDYLGGIFGTTNGANAYLNMFLILISVYELILWLQKKESFHTILTIFIIALMESVLCEIKVYFVEVAIIIALSFFVLNLVYNNTLILKGICLGAGALFLIVIALQFLYSLYPRFTDFFSSRYFIEEMTRPGGYTNSGDLNRLTAISTINDTVFSDSLLKKIFGMGLGSTEYSGKTALLTSPFYRIYEYLHYQWFSHAWLYLECGYIGIISYLAGFFELGMKGVARAKQMQKNELQSSYVLAAVVLNFMTIILFIYNQSLRLESAYLLYICLSAIYVGEKKNGHIPQNKSKCNSSYL